MVVVGSKVQNFFHVATYVAEGRESYRSRVEVLGDFEERAAFQTILSILLARTPYNRCKRSFEEQEALPLIPPSFTSEFFRSRIAILVIL